MEVKTWFKVVLDGLVVENFHQFRSIFRIFNKLVRLVEGQRVLELLGKVFIDRLATLKDRPTVFEALNLF